jgi:hypothetical protein
MEAEERVVRASVFLKGIPRPKEYEVCDAAGLPRALSVALLFPHGTRDCFVILPENISPSALRAILLRLFNAGSRGYKGLHRQSARTGRLADLFTRSIVRPGRCSVRRYRLAPAPINRALRRHSAYCPTLRTSAPHIPTLLHNTVVSDHLAEEMHSKMTLREMRQKIARNGCGLPCFRIRKRGALYTKGMWSESHLS